MELIHQIVSEVSGYRILELIAVVLAVIYVVLASREIVWCWPAGIISSALFTFVFFEVNYQLEAILNIFYVAIGFYGWYEWTAGLSKKNNKAIIVSYSIRRLIPIIIIGILLFLTLGYIFEQYFQSDRSYLDAFTTVFAIITTWMATKKILENWIFWIIIDGFSILLYVQKELYFTSLLFIIYIIISIYGYMHWKNELKHYND